MPKKKKKPINRKALNRKTGKVDIFLFLALFFWLLLLVLIFDPTPFTGGDNAHYRALAESILEGNFNRIYEPGAPPETSTPPGYPLLLAPFCAIWPDSFIPPKIVLSLLTYLGALFISYKLFRFYGVNKWIALGIPTLLTVNIRISEFSHWCLTEAPSMFFVVLAILLLEISFRDKNTILFIISSVIAVFAVYVRLANLPLVVGFFLYIIYRRKWKKLALFSIIAFLGLFPWGIWTFSKGSSGSNFYFQHLLSNEAGGTNEVMGFKDLFFRLWGNFRTYTFGHLPNLLFAPFISSYSKTIGLTTIIGILFTPIWLAGIVKRLQKKNVIVIPFIIIPYLIMLYFWAHPRWSCVRYLVGGAPLFLFAYFEGLDYLKNWVKERIVHYIKIALMLLSIFIALFNFFPDSYTKLNYLPSVKNNIKNINLYLKGYAFPGYPISMTRFIEACRWIKGNTPYDAILISRKPKLSYMWSRRPSKCYKLVPNSRAIIADIDSSNIDFILVDSFMPDTYNYLIPAIQTYPHRFALVYKTAPPETYVLKVLPESETSSFSPVDSNTTR